MSHTEPKVWIAHSEPDRAEARALSEGLDRQQISVLNDYVDYRIRSGEDERDVLTASISSADHVIVLLSAHSNADDLITQIKRARSLGKLLSVVVAGDQSRLLQLPCEQDLTELISGLPHVYSAARRTFVDLVARIKSSPVAAQTHAATRDQKSEHFSVFISKKSQDYPYAKRVYDFLTARQIRTFLSEASLPDLGSAEYMKAIDNALENAEHLVVVGSRPEYLLSGWVEAEWRVFINEKRSGRKTGNVVTVAVGDMTPAHLPMSLRYFEVVGCSDEGLERLLSFVSPTPETETANKTCEATGDNVSG